MNFKLPYLFEYKSHFFCTKILPKKSSATYRIHKVHCVRYKIFLRYFLAITFYAITFHTIALYYLPRNIALLTLLLFSRSIALAMALSSIDANHVTMHHLPTSWDAEGHSRGRLGLFEDSDSSDDFNGF